ncbi:MAG: helix-turn-helix domain-containing protein, partial [Rhodospirillales bacterium]|nr:helix-turn-helix domain-containing protein [Rhodospirillales bacterium]
MAKMFYTLEEAAEKLGLDENAVKDMAQSGKLQQFRDRDKLMFKRDQVDAMVGPAAGESGLDESGIPLMSSGDTDAIDLAEDRDRFNALIKKLRLQQPESGIAGSPEEARTEA